MAIAKNLCNHVCASVQPGSNFSQMLVSNFKNCSSGLPELPAADVGSIPLDVVAVELPVVVLDVVVIVLVVVDVVVDAIFPCCCCDRVILLKSGLGVNLFI